MSKNFIPKSVFFHPRFLVSVSFWLSGIFMAALSLAATPREAGKASVKENHSITNKRPQRGSTMTASQTATLSVPSGPGWSIVTSPNDGTDKWNFLTDVTCLSRFDCWAFGTHRNSNGFDQTLAEHWDGHSWSIVPTPNLDTGNNYLERVTCASASDCWATGDYDNSTLGVRQTLVAHWDGIMWSIVPSPNNGAVSNRLYGAT